MQLQKLYKTALWGTSLSNVITVFGYKRNRFRSAAME